jgi:hypothetical protein
MPLLSLVVLCIAGVRVGCLWRLLTMIVPLEVPLLVKALLLLPTTLLLHLLPLSLLTLVFLLEVTFELLFVAVLSFAEATIALTLPLSLHLLPPLCLIFAWLLLWGCWLPPVRVIRAICVLGLQIDDLTQFIVPFLRFLIAQHFVSRCNSLEFLLVGISYSLRLSPGTIWMELLGFLIKTFLNLKLGGPTFKIK